MQFSVVIPAYNYGHMLERAVRSACSQAGEDFEVIVVDDGSSDNTPDVLAGLCEHYPDLRSHRQDNAGAGAARNTGVALAQGKMILFLDADDELLPGALAAFRKKLEDVPEAQMLIAPMVSVFPDGREKTAEIPRVSADPEERFLDYLYKKLRLSNGAVVVARDLLQRSPINPALRQTEDIPVFAQCLAAAYCVALEQPVVKIYKHDTSRRHATDAALSVGMGLVDEIFNPDRLPMALMRHRERYRARRAMSLFRLLYRGSRFREARAFFGVAIDADWREALSKPENWIKYLRCWLRP